MITGDSERLAALQAVTEQLVPGQWEYARRPTRKELAATAVLKLPLAEASVKIRAGRGHDEPRELRDRHLGRGAARPADLRCR